MFASLLDRLYSRVVTSALRVVSEWLMCPGVLWDLNGLLGLKHLLFCMLGTAVVHNRGCVLEVVDRLTIVPTIWASRSLMKPRVTVGLVNRRPAVVQLGRVVMSCSD